MGVLKVLPFRPLQEHGGCERGNAVQITYDLSDYKSKTYLSRVSFSVARGSALFFNCL